jgi:hypothetical protein
VPHGNPPVWRLVGGWCSCTRLATADAAAQLLRQAATAKTTANERIVDGGFSGSKRRWRNGQQRGFKEVF